MAASIQSATSCMAVLAYQIHAIEKQAQTVHLRGSQPLPTEWIDRAVEEIRLSLRKEASPLEESLACFWLALEDPSKEVLELSRMLEELPDAFKEKLPKIEPEDLIANPRILLMYHNDEGHSFLDVCLHALHRRASLDSVDAGEFARADVEMPNLELRQKLYRDLAQRRPDFFLSAIENIKVPKFHEELARILLGRNPVELCENIEKFSLDSSRRFSIAQECAQRVPLSLSKHIDRFSLNDVERTEIAKICLQRDSSVLPYLSSFDLSEEARFALFQELNVSGLYDSHLSHFDLTESQRRVLLPDLIQRDPRNLVHAIAVIPEELHEVFAKRLMGDGCLWEVLPKLHLSEDFRYALAVEMGQNNPNSVMNNIAAFRLESKEKRCALARTLGPVDPDVFAMNLTQFAIAREDDREEEITKILLQTRPFGFAKACGSWEFSQKERLGYLDGILAREEELVSLSRTGRIGDGVARIICNFDQYAIEEEKKRCALFLELFKRRPVMALEKFSLFKISSSQYLKKIVLHCAETYPALLAKHIAVFGLNTQENWVEEVKMEAAKLCIQHGDKEIASYIPAFAIRHKKNAIELVLQYTIRHGGSAEACKMWCQAAYGDNPSLEKKLQWIAQIASNVRDGKIPSSMLETLRDIVVYPQEPLASLYMGACKRVSLSQESIIKYQERISDAAYLKLPMLQICEWEMDFEGRLQIGAFLEEDLNAYLREIDDDVALLKRESLQKWVDQARRYYKGGDDDRERQWIADLDRDLSSINFEYSLAGGFGFQQRRLIDTFCSNLGLEEEHTAAALSFVEETGRKKWCDRITQGLMQAQESGILETFRSQRREQIAKRAQMRQDIADIQNTLKRYKRELKYAHSIEGLMHPCLVFMKAVSSVRRLDPEEKIRFVAKILSMESEGIIQVRIRTASTLCTICSQGRSDLLQQVMQEGGTLMSRLMQGLRSDEFFHQAVEHPCFETAYPRTLDKMRVPDAWLTYGNVLRYQPDEVKTAFHQAIDSILRAALHVDRYSVEGERRKHLRLLQETLGDERWALWQVGYAAEPCIVDLAEKKSHFEFQNFLKEKCRHGHLERPGQELGHLKHFLENPTEELLTQYSEESSKDSENAIFAAEVQLMQWFLDQPALEDLAKDEASLSKVSSVLQDFEIANDLQGLFKQLSGMKKVQVVDTDDWMDLFLCGTEVQGSCQRVDGSANLNQCLLAYILDGKNRLIAVKDAQSGEIQARAILRLLFCEDKPVLFLEEIYPAVCPPAFQDKIMECAKQRADSLGLDLYVAGEKSELVSLGSIAPFEYFDSAEEGVNPGDQQCVIRGTKVPLQSDRK